jgi:hypothetical protein
MKCYVFTYHPQYDQILENTPLVLIGTNNLCNQLWFRIPFMAMCVRWAIGYGVLRHFQQYFNYIVHVAVNFMGGGNLSKLVPIYIGWSIPLNLKQKAWQI